MSGACALPPFRFSARSARMLPITGANLKPWPLQAEARTTCSGGEGGRHLWDGIVAGGVCPWAPRPSGTPFHA